MKKTIIFLMTILLVLPLCVSSVAFAEEISTNNAIDYVMGDANRDGVVNSTDYLRVKKYFLGEFSLKGTAYAMADVDYNGIIDATDYMKIKSVLLGFSEFDESLWDYEEQQPSVKYKTEGATYITGVFECIDMSFCLGKICGVEGCKERFYQSGNNVFPLLGAGVYADCCYDPADRLSIDADEDIFLCGYAKPLNYVDESVPQTISVEYDEYGIIELNYTDTDDYIFSKRHYYSLDNPEKFENVERFSAIVDGITGEIIRCGVLCHIPSDSGEVYSLDERLSMAKKSAKSLFENPECAFFRGMNVDTSVYRLLEAANMDIFYFPVMLNGYKTDVEVSVTTRKNGVISYGISGFSWIFNVDKRSVDIDENMEHYEISKGYEAYVHGVQTREIRINSFMVTVTTKGTLGLLLDADVYNVYTQSIESYPYDDDIPALALPRQQT